MMTLDAGSYTSGWGGGTMNSNRIVLTRSEVSLGTPMTAFNNEFFQDIHFNIQINLRLTKYIANITFHVIGLDNTNL